MNSPDQPKTNVFDYISSREILYRELSVLNSVQTGQSKLPEVYPEKNEIKVQFMIPTFSKELVFDSLQIIKTHIENIRIHTFEPGFYSFQALNENIFDSKTILDNIRFRFINSRTQNRVEIAKKGDFKREEIYTIISLYKFFHESVSKKSANPKELLARLGITVFDPEEEILKNNVITFDFIAGYELVKKEIVESIVMPILNPDAFDEVAKLTRKFPTINRPRAVLFEGDPGVGKTTMAKIVSCMCRIPLVYVPIESIMSKYYGESAQNLAYVFDAAELFPSSLIFLDEIDSLAGSRDDGMIEATRKILSVLLRKLDGFEGKPKTMTIGATNRKQDLDRALVSRFDKSIYFPLPDVSERTAILGNYSVHLNDTERIAISELLNGYSGRNIKDFCDLVERKWATHIIQNMAEIEAPPYNLYLESAKVLNRMK